MSRDRLAALQAQKRREQGYAPQQAPAMQQQGGPVGAGAPSLQPASAQETSMYPVGGQQGSPVSPVQQSPQQGYGQSAYNQQPPMAQGVQSQPYQQQQQAPYSGQGAGNYEMQQVGGAPVGAVGGFGSGAPALGPGANQQAFFGEIDLIANSLQQLKNNITQIDTLHNTVLNSTTNEARQEAAQRDLEQMTAETSKMTNSIKLRIKNLSELNDKQQHTLSPSDLNTQRMQVAALKQRFMNYIQEYREVEQKSRDKYRARMERQYKIVKPDATQEEIKYAMDTDQGSQVFASALTQSTRYADARNAYREVQERHEDIKKIAQTMQELQQLFNDMAMLVERQDEQIQTIEATAVDVETNMAAANVQIDKGVKSARKARRKRWICFWILVIIIIVVVLAVTLSVLNKQGKI